jgi:hypothetical protein
MAQTVLIIAVFLSMFLDRACLILLPDGVRKRRNVYEMETAYTTHTISCSRDIKENTSITDEHLHIPKPGSTSVILQT